MTQRVIWSYRGSFLLQTCYCHGDLQEMYEQLIIEMPFLRLLDYQFYRQFINFSLPSYSDLQEKYEEVLYEILQGIKSYVSLSGHEFLVDCFGVNIGKVVHYGNIRSGIVGNTIARIISKIDGKVKTDVHYGDYGDVLAIFVKYFRNKPLSLIKNTSLTELKSIYSYAKSLAVSDITDCLIDQKTVDPIHSLLMQVTKKYIDKISSLFSFNFDFQQGEYRYRGLSYHIAQTLIYHGLAKLEEGRIITNDGVVLTRSNGTPLYVLNDISALIDRVVFGKYKNIIYIADSRQQEHFNYMFDFCKKVLNIESINMVHMKMGIVRNENRAIFRGRDSDVSDILDYVKKASYSLCIDEKVVAMGFALYNLRHRIEKEYVLCDHLIKDCVIHVFDFKRIVDEIFDLPRSNEITTDEMMFINRVIQTPMVFRNAIDSYNTHVIYTHFISILTVLRSLEGLEVHDITYKYMKIAQEYFKNICF